MLNELRGMYAFAIWDRNKEGLFLARDPFGIKPLYYSDNGHTFRVASQVKPLRDCGKIDLAPDPAGHVGYFLWGHVPDPYTLFRNIRSLPAGNSMWVDRSGPRSPRVFCNISRILADAERSEAGDQKSELVGQAFLPAEAINSGKRERLPYSSQLLREALCGDRALPSCRRCPGGRFPLFRSGFHHHRGAGGGAGGRLANSHTRLRRI